MKIDEKEVMDAALKVLREGGLILYPTDTVWGIGCDATNPEAVQKVYRLKDRSDSKALVLLASDLDMVARYVREIPGMAVQLVEVNDRPMTLVYPEAIKGKEGVSDRHFLAWNAVAGDGSVAIRIPMSAFCRNLAFKLGRPIVSTSANVSGEAAPAAFEAISSQIKGGVDYIVPAALGHDATGRSSQIIAVGLDGSVKIIRA